jgi:multidrug efflux pump subunit AcrA (membrane-fusion protein)
MNWKFVALPALAVAGIVAAAVTVAKQNKPLPAPPPTVPPVASPYGDRVSGSGIVEPSSELIELGAPVSGLIEEVVVQEGQRVAKGEPLFVIDRRALRAQLGGAHARLAAAEARYAQARSLPKAETLAQAQARTETRVEELAATMTSFANVLNQLVIRSDRHEGSLLELRFRDRLPSYLGRFLRKGHVIQASDLIDQIEPKLAEAAVDDFLRTDVVATGLIEGKPTYLVGEVSYTVDADDVMRAARRAACLVKAGLSAIPLVACEKISPQTTAYARQEGVRVWVDGSLLDA